VGPYPESRRDVPIGALGVNGLAEVYRNCTKQSPLLSPRALVDLVHHLDQYRVFLKTKTKPVARQNKKGCSR
jgi:hypothetical protein